MIFFSPEDKGSSGEHLFIYLRHMNSLLALKFYGSRRSGNFTVYLNDKKKEMMIKELQLQPGAGNFSFNNFLSDLDINIPQELPEQIRVETLRDVWPCVSKELSDVVDESHKTIGGQFRRTFPVHVRKMNVHFSAYCASCRAGIHTG